MSLSHWLWGKLVRSYKLPCSFKHSCRRVWPRSSVRTQVWRKHHRARSLPKSRIFSEDKKHPLLFMMHSDWTSSSIGLLFSVSKEHGKMLERESLFDTRKRLSTILSCESSWVFFETVSEEETCLLSLYLLILLSIHYQILCRRTQEPDSFVCQEKPASCDCRQPQN